MASIRFATPHETGDDSELVQHCVSFAEVYGVDEMLDLIAGVYQSYNALASDPAIKAAYEIASQQMINESALDTLN